jgi:dipeptidyl aminopeptidase/acylaminoacyl peptidase
VITVNPSVKAAVLYAAMSGDERQNYEAINSWSYSIRGLEELAVPLQELGRISPIYFLENITAAVAIHHGAADELVPLEWSQDLCNRLTDLGKAVECFTYPKMPHTFYGEGEQLFNQRVIDFFNRELRR